MVRLFFMPNHAKNFMRQTLLEKPFSCFRTHCLHHLFFLEGRGIKKFDMFVVRRVFFLL